MVDAQAETAAGRTLFELVRRLAAHSHFAQAAARLQAGTPVVFSGAAGSSCALTAAALAISGTPQPAASAFPVLLAVLPSAAEVDFFVDDWRSFSSLPLAAFPFLEGEGEENALREEAEGLRLRALKALAAHKTAGPLVLVSPMPALMQGVPAPHELAANTRVLEVGSVHCVNDLAQFLAANGFHATGAVEMPGEFALRGGIFDVYPLDAECPLRVEFFGDEIASLRRFDVATQRSRENIAVAELTVARVSSGPPASLFDYLPAGSGIVLIEPDRIEAEGKHFLARVERPERYFSPAQTLARAAEFSLANLYAFAPALESEAVSLPLGTATRFGGEMSRVREELAAAAETRNVLIVAATEAEADRLREVFAGSDLETAGRLQFATGRLREGFSASFANLLVLSGADLFQRGDLRRAPARRTGRAIDSFLDLREGDLVVHLAHGIARYRGLEMITKEGQVIEHLVLEFDGGTRVYVPAAKIDLVQKYVGGRSARPKLAKIGGRSWSRQKEEAAAAVMDMAAELLEVEAQRATRPGIAFADDSEWQREFDQMFPYRETPDQLTAIAAIKADMRRPRPMDRLLCGDVGFGKTEVAMRAAFKAVDSGYQVAVLVPTTILCEQHFHTFRERMAEFPCDVAKLSRFCTPQEERRTLAGLKAGSVDIVVGTHRLASADVKFANLGLLVIDEEQRFGVEVKDRLKKLRATVDVLTMTATPIPRTLHMSLSGLRDIANLETPPEDRVPVETKVARFDRELVRHAVLRELSRGGQVYFVHNRVHDIQAVANVLRQTVPEASLRIGHGQMNEHELERVMVDFVAGKFDLLLATTIVESGLDIPNANTIFIDEADRYGLADLHQLRGRVGRYKHRAYCYLLVDPRKHLSPTALRRLRAIEEFSEMGAGFAIAMRDLELRGAGNILGTQQSGHIAAVGYELYCELLEAAVRKMRRQAPKLKLEVDIDLPGETYLPRAYVPDMRQKIDLYRRMARIESDADLTEIRRELLDRFGPLPEPVARMLRIVELRIDAAVWQVVGIRREDRYLVLHYSDRRRIEQLAKQSRGAVRVVDERTAYLTVPPTATTPDDLILLAKSLLRAG